MPGVGDTVTVEHAVTVDVDATVGHSPAADDPTAALAITGSGVLDLDEGVTLTVRGDLDTASAVGASPCLTIAAGSVLEFDASAADEPSRTHYRLILGHYDPDGTVDATLVARGTAEHRCQIRSRFGAANARIVVSALWRGGMDLEFTDLYRLGTATEPAFEVPGGNIRGLRMVDSVAISSGRFLATGVLHPKFRLELRRSSWKGTLQGDEAVTMPVGAPTTGREPAVIDCVFDKFADFGDTLNRGFVVRDNIFAGGATWSPHFNTLDDGGNFIRLPQSRAGTDFRANLKGDYVLLDYASHAEGFHFFVNAISGGPIIRDSVFESAIGSDGTYGFLRLTGSPSSNYPKTLTVLRNVMVGAGGMFPIFDPYVNFDGTHCNVVVEHNTLRASGNVGRPAALELGSQPAGFVTSLKSNLIYGESDVENQVIVRGVTTDSATPSGVNHNAGFHLTAGQSGGGYDLPMTGSFGVDFGADDVPRNADPLFADGDATGVPRRGLAAWYRHVSGSSTGTDAGDRAAAIAELSKKNDDDHDPAYRLDGLLEWVRAGYMPNAASLIGTAHDGGDIGAVVVENASDYVVIGPDAGLPGVPVMLTVSPSAATTATITFSDGDAGGSFDPAMMTFDGESDAREVVYTPPTIEPSAAPLAIALSATNDGGLVDPDARTYTIEYPALAGRPAFEAALRYGADHYDPDAGLSVNADDHYDAPRDHFQVWKYCEANGLHAGVDFEATFNAAARKYRDHRLLPSGAAMPGYNKWVTGLRHHWEEYGASESRSRDAALFLANNPTYLEYHTNSGHAREVAFSVLMAMDAERLGAAHNDNVEGAISALKVHIDKWTSAPPDNDGSNGWQIDEREIGGGQHYYAPFMCGLACEALIRYWDLTRDASIPPKVKAILDYMWEYGWGSTQKAFDYHVYGVLDPSYRGYGSPQTSLLIAHAYAWYYWYAVHVLGDRDNEYRRRHDLIFDGSTPVVGSYHSLKEFTQGTRLAFHGLRWRARGDTEWPSATSYTLEHLDDASGMANRMSGRVRAELSGAETSLAAPVTITPADVGAGGTFFPSSAKLTTDQRSVVFRYRPPSTADGSTVSLSATNDGGLADPPAIPYDVTGVAPFATGLRVTGPTRIPVYPTVVKTDGNPVTEDRGETIFEVAGGVPTDVDLVGDFVDIGGAWHPITAHDGDGRRLTVAGTGLGLSDGMPVTVFRPSPVTYSLAPEGAAVPSAFDPDAGMIWVNRVPSPAYGTYKVDPGLVYATERWFIGPDDPLTVYYMRPAWVTTRLGANDVTDRIDDSARLEVVLSSTPPAPPAEPLSAPTNVSASAASPTSVDLAWDAATGGDTSGDGYEYEVLYGTSDGGPAGTSGGATSETSLTVVGLSPGTTYDFIVRVIDDESATDDSTQTSVTTPAIASSYTLEGPESGTVGLPSSEFTVAPDAALGGTIVPSDGGAGGTFSPGSLTWSGTSEPRTFTYTPAVVGVVTISTTNDADLTDPPPRPYESSAGPRQPTAVPWFPQLSRLRRTRAARIGF